jgi:DNA-binding beta-propeller fold protein YncE
MPRSEVGASEITDSEIGMPHRCEVVTVDGDGRLYVAARWHSPVSVFDSDGTFLYNMFDDGTPKGFEGLVVDALRGRLLAVDCGLNRLRVFDNETGGLLARLDEGLIGRPYGVCADRHGNVVAFDSWSHRLCVFDASLARQFSFGSAGTGAGQFDHPIRASFAGDLLTVADWGNGRVQVLRVTYAGTRILRLSFKTAFYHDKRNAPWRVCADPVTGCVLISDTNNYCLSVFDTQLRFVREVEFDSFVFDFCVTEDGVWVALGKHGLKRLARAAVFGQ